jgi:heme exporter protein D
MSYFKYVALAYGVFFVVLAWDFIIPRLQLRQQLREARGRLARASRATATPSDGGELTR